MLLFQNFEIKIETLIIAGFGIDAASYCHFLPRDATQSAVMRQ